MVNGSLLCMFEGRQPRIYMFESLKHKPLTINSLTLQPMRKRVKLVLFREDALLYQINTPR